MVCGLPAGRIERLADTVYPAGRHTVEWRPAQLPTGIYHYVVRVRGTPMATGQFVYIR